MVKDLEMEGLKQMDKIEVPTSNGGSEIRLSFGSVTKLSKKDSVDVLVISAYPDDYTPTLTSVIGALKRDLGISVQSLSENKEEDIRRLFSCWWSKPLSGDYNFKRILCFEGGYKKSARPPMVVGEVFRSLVSLCEKQQDMKVLMPLLASGDQGYGEKMMLRLTVETAIHWMQIGLPLEMVNIVIFTTSFFGIDRHPMLECFQQLKSSWKNQWENNTEKSAVNPIYYDVYLSYSFEDEGLVDRVKQQLIKSHNKLRIYTHNSGINGEKAWHETIYKIMKSCKMFLAILSPGYLANEGCLEEYSTALSCARKLRQSHSTEFCFASVKEMPMLIHLNPDNESRPLENMKIAQACFAANNFLDEHFSYCYETHDDVESGYRSFDPPEFDDGACEHDEDIEPIQEQRKLNKVPSEHSDFCATTNQPMDNTTETTSLCQETQQGNKINNFQTSQSRSQFTSNIGNNVTDMNEFLTFKSDTEK